MLFYETYLILNYNYEGTYKITLLKVGKTLINP